MATIVSKPVTKKYSEGWDRIFGNKDKNKSGELKDKPPEKEAVKFCWLSDNDDFKQPYPAR